jgi:hypothetical protein
MCADNDEEGEGKIKMLEIQLQHSSVLLAEVMGKVEEEHSGAAAVEVAEGEDAPLNGGATCEVPAVEQHQRC